MKRVRLSNILLLIWRKCFAAQGLGARPDASLKSAFFPALRKGIVRAPLSSSVELVMGILSLGIQQFRLDFYFFHFVRRSCMG